MLLATRKLYLAIPLLALVACEREATLAPGEATGFATAYNRWTPGPDDTCTAEQHNAYSTIGPDGLLYPAWHPPTDETTGCTFGHDHGRDPRGSALYASVGQIPLGYANEQLAIYDPTTIRHEDHVGHKIEWENDMEMNFGDDLARELFGVRCDLLTKLHQGTHSKDAFTNNLHELVYHIDCTDGTKFNMTIMAAIGTAGEFVASCDRDRHVTVGPPSPLTSPDGGGKRIIPDRICMDQEILVADGSSSDFSGGLRESWQISQSLRTSEGKRLVHISPYYQVIAPSRFHDPALADLTGRPIDVCYEIGPSGERAQGGLCDESTAEGAIVGLAFDDPQSRFNGAHRFVDVNSNDVTNPDGPEIWYTDPFGHNGSTESFAGSIRQFIARIDNQRGARFSGPNIGRDRDYGRPGLGVHAPN